MHDDPCQEARGTEMRTSVTVHSQCVVLVKAKHPVEEVHHAGNHEQGTAPFVFEQVNGALS